MKAAARIALYRPGARAGWGFLPVPGTRRWWAIGLAISASVFVFGLTQLFEDKCGGGPACACAQTQPSIAAAATATPATILLAKACASGRHEALAGAP